MELTFEDVFNSGPPQEPLEENFQVTIHRGISVNAEAFAVPFDPREGAPSREKFFLISSLQGYMLNGRPNISLDHHGQDWGELFFCLVLSRTELQEATENSLSAFQAPDPEDVQHVVVKKLNKAVVKTYLENGGHEDPYKEIVRMQQLGDGVHVLPIVEALEDDQFLYIITPFCTDGTLLEAIRFREGLPEARALVYFKNILEILEYLELHGICHHDISPDNLLFYNGRLVLFDFAMSFRVPREEEGRRRFLTLPQGRFGTFATQAPELFHNESAFDGIATDLWSACVVLYFVITGFPLYELPYPVDIKYLYYILAEGLQPGLNEQMVEIMEEAFQPGNESNQQALMVRAMANLNIPPGALEILTHVLVHRPADRWTLQQVLDSAWVQHNP